MSSSLITAPLRLSLRTVRVALQVTRVAADAGLELIELIGAMVPPSGRESTPPPVFESEAVSPVEAVEAVEAVETVSPFEAVPPIEADPIHLDAGAEVVDEVAEAGAEEGAGAQIRVAPPFDGYDALRAADVVTRLRGADAALLGAIALHEQTHRERRTVLEAIAREQRRR